MLFSMGLVGRMLVRPAHALRAVEERARGGMLAAALLIAVLPFARASALLPTVWDIHPVSAAFGRLLLRIVTEAAIAAALLVVVLRVLQARVDRGRLRSR